MLPLLFRKVDDVIFADVITAVFQKAVDLVYLVSSRDIY